MAFNGQVPTETGVTVADETLEEIELLPTVQIVVSSEVNVTVNPVATLELFFEVAETENVDPYGLELTVGKSIVCSSVPKVNGTMSP